MSPEEGLTKLAVQRRRDRWRPQPRQKQLKYSNLVGNRNLLFFLPLSNYLHSSYGPGMVPSISAFPTKFFVSVVLLMHPRWGGFLLLVLLHFRMKFVTRPELFLVLKAVKTNIKLDGGEKNLRESDVKNTLGFLWRMKWFGLGFSLAIGSN